MERRLSARLAAGDVIVVDDAEVLDRLSGDVIERCRVAGAVLRAFRSAPPDGLRLEPLTERAIRKLFAGSDRVHFIPQDAAHEMYRRTDGWPARIASEITAWERAGLARFEAGYWITTRASVERLRSGLWVSAHATAIREGSVVDDPALEEVAVCIDLADRAATIDVVSQALDRPRWLVEADIEELVRLGVVRSGTDGHLEALRPTHGGVEWAADRRLALHGALADALPKGTVERLVHRVSAGAVDAVPAEALATGEALLERGEASRAGVAIEEGLRAIQECEETAIATDLLALFLRRALRSGRLPALDTLLYHLQHVPRATPHVDLIERIARSAISALQGNAQHAIANLGDLPDHVPTEIGGAWWAVLVLASRLASPEREREAVARAQAWAARHPEQAAHLPLDQWRGWLRYREGRYAEAAAIHERSAARQTDRGAVLVARLNAASAWLEANEWERAKRLADESREEATRQRHALSAARAEWISRAAAYRGGLAGGVDHELVGAVARLGSPYLQALVLLNEAAVAWRSGDHETARSLALESADLCRSMRQEPAAGLATALAAAAGARLATADLSRVLAEAWTSSEPAVAVQVVGLLARAPGTLTRHHALHAHRRAEEVTRKDWPHRREVLSIQEALAAIDGTSPHAGT